QNPKSLQIDTFLDELYDRKPVQSPEASHIAEQTPVLLYPVPIRPHITFTAHSYLGTTALEPYPSRVSRPISAYERSLRLSAADLIAANIRPGCNNNQL